MTINQLIKKMQTIITHSGAFHCDEVLAYSILKYIHDDNVVLIRTRDVKVIASYIGKAYIIDVGGVYNPETLQYDHHQPTFKETYDAHSTVPLSSAGIVYKHHARTFLEKYTKGTFTGEKLNMLADKVYDQYIKHIDANDNGVEIGARFPIMSAIYARVGRMNPRWNESPDLAASRFEKASKAVTEDLFDMIDTIINDHFMTYDVVEEYVKDAKDDILIMRSKVPWKTHLTTLENIYSKHFMFVVYPDEGDTWKLHAIPLKGFMNRMVIPTHLSTMPGVIFIHKAGFVAACKTLEAAIALGQTSIEYFNPVK